MTSHLIHLHYKIDSKGFSAIPMVLIVLALGGVMIKTFSQITMLWQKDYSQSNRYFEQFNHAQSSIEWAVTQQWQHPTEQWQCKIFKDYQLSACIKLSGLIDGKFVIIKGQFQQLKLFHLASFNNGYLILQLGHWLDYCPNNKRRYCE